VIVVKMTAPRTSSYAAETAAPVTKAILEAAVAAREVGLDRTRLAASMVPSKKTPFLTRGEQAVVFALQPPTRTRRNGRPARLCGDIADAARKAAARVRRRIPTSAEWPSRRGAFVAQCGFPRPARSSGKRSTGRQCVSRNESSCRRAGPTGTLVRLLFDY
jgi:hypothetical protein